MGAGRNQRIVRDHQDGLVVLADQFLDQRHDFIGALAVEVTRRLVAKEKSRVRDNGACDGDALLLSPESWRGK